jgi:pimeloyl-ACP methyl ester carboxylesterase
MSKPIFVCVPGASHSPAIYDTVKSALAYYGYELTAIALPSVGCNPATYDFTEDVRAIRHVVSYYVDSGRDVVLVMHGYGGIPGSEALLGLGKTEREQRRLRGGVIRLVFIMSVCTSVLNGVSILVRFYCFSSERWRIEPESHFSTS